MRELSNVERAAVESCETAPMLDQVRAWAAVNSGTRNLQGLARTDRPAFCFQGHPEASPGPHDIGYLFERFAKLMADAKA